MDRPSARRSPESVKLNGSEHPERPEHPVTLIEAPLRASAVDPMFQDVQEVARKEIALLRNKVIGKNFKGLTPKERQWFKDMAQIVRGMAETEIRLEKHYQEVDDKMEVAEIKALIRGAILQDKELLALAGDDVLQRLAGRVLSALGMTK